MQSWIPPRHYVIIEPKERASNGKNGRGGADYDGAVDGQIWS